MPEPVPAIFAPPAKPLRMSLYARAIALAIAGCCVFVIYQAVTLTPSPEGYGTHRELGFQPCTMMDVTGIPCPTCGMTTSFAWFFRGNLLASLWVQPAGFAGAYFTAMLLPVALYEALTGRPLHRMARLLNGKFWLILLLSILAGGWLWKIATTLAGASGW